MSRRTTPLKNYSSSGTKRELVLKDERLEKESMAKIYESNEAKRRFDAFRNSKIEPAKLMKYIQNKYDIIVSEESSQILATLGGFV